MDLTKTSTEATTAFVEAYYTCLQESRTTMDMYYVNKSTLTDGATVPSIIWNGNQYEDAPAFQKMFQEQMPEVVLYDVQTIDCQVLNPKWDPVATIKPEKNISILVMTNGHVRLENRRTGPLKEFSETFVLVPNIEKAANEKSAMAQKRSWLIQTQNFRYVVHHNPLLTEGQIAMDIA